MGKEKIEIKKKKIEPEVLFYFEFVGIIIIMLSLVVLGKFGVIGNFLYVLFVVIFGDWYWLFLIILLGIGIFTMITHELPKKKSRRVLGVITLFLSLLIISHIPFLKMYKSNVIGGTWGYYTTYVEQANTSTGDLLYGGGMIGAVLVRLSSLLLGEMGTFLFSLVIIFFGISTIWDKSLSDYKKMITGARGNIGGMFTNLSEKLDKVRSYKSDVQVKGKVKEKEKGIVSKDIASRGMKIKPKLADKKSEYVEDVTTSRKYIFPSISLLNTPKRYSNEQLQDNINKQHVEIIVKILRGFVLDGRVVEVKKSYKFTTIEVDFVDALNEKLLDDFKQCMLKEGIYDKCLFCVDKGKLTIYVTNKFASKVFLYRCIEKTISERLKGSDKIIVGMDKYNCVAMWDFRKNRHVLIGSTTKDTIRDLFRTIIVSTTYLFKPSEVKILVFDVQKSEFSDCNGVPHLVKHVIKNPNDGVETLTQLKDEVKRRLELFDKSGVFDIDTFNERRQHQGFSKLARMYVLIHEIADLLMYKKSAVEQLILHLTQVGHTVGIHLIVGTYHPIKTAVSDPIKAQIPTRASFNLDTVSQSVWLLEKSGAEQLVGSGEMLYVDEYDKLVRVSVPNLSEDEYLRVVKFLK